MALGEPPHTVSESQVDGFKPVNHYRVAGRKETESEWYEVVVNVPIPEAAERKHVNVILEGDRLAVRVAGWMSWERRIQARTLHWEDKHESRTHVDLHNSTWLMTRDEERDVRCVQFVLSEWQEGANKNAETDVRRQLNAEHGNIILEDADPMHMYDLVEAEMFLRAVRADVLHHTLVRRPQPSCHIYLRCLPGVSYARVRVGETTPRAVPLALRVLSSSHVVSCARRHWSWWST